MTATDLSITVRKLEQELELTLLHRGERRITPTVEGEVLQSHARKLLELTEAAELEMRELRGLAMGEVRLGIPNMLGSCFFPPILMGLKHRHPELRLSVYEHVSRRLQQMIHDGELDLGVVVADRPSDGLVAVPFEEPVFLDLSLAWKQGGTLSRADRAFVDDILDQAASVTGLTDSQAGPE
jgi:DNA-binding transcriptional LysR family regulator